MADDFGIGPNTSQGILDLAAQGRVTSTVLLVNSPHAESAVTAWKRQEAALEIGWHVCLTLDRPILPPDQVPTLVGPDRRFRPLGAFLGRLLCGRVNPAEVASEMMAQHRRFIDLVGVPPAFVNAHHHLHCFAPIGRLLIDLLARQKPLPYLRRVREPLRLLAQVPGARLKRSVLSHLGRRTARQQDGIGLPGNDWLAGITNPPCLDDPEFYARWLTRIPGRAVELTCHPGYPDDTLIGRDGSAGDGLILRRIRELELLREDRFLQAVRQAGFRLIAPSQLVGPPTGRSRHVA
jgi:predicted glycoside hydrolase/deacetylase ChbG (UPF0249 family)